MSTADFNLLITLDVLLAEGSVARAAKRLRLSPSAMSRALARLRETTGDPLLVRAGRGLVPTPRALALREQVSQLVQEVEAVLRGAAGRLVLLYLPTYSPWLNPIEMLWRHFRREVTHCELFGSVEALITAAGEFFDRYNRSPGGVCSIIGSHPA